MFQRYGVQLTLSFYPRSLSIGILDEHIAIKNIVSAESWWWNSGTDLAADLAVQRSLAC